MNEYLMSSEEAAVYIDEPLTRLLKQRLYGKGPRYVRAGRWIRYRKRDLDEYMKTKETANNGL